MSKKYELPLSPSHQKLNFRDIFVESRNGKCARLGRENENEKKNKT